MPLLTKNLSSLPLILNILRILPRRPDVSAILFYALLSPTHQENQ